MSATIPPLSTISSRWDTKPSATAHWTDWLKMFRKRFSPRWVRNRLSILGCGNRSSTLRPTKVRMATSVWVWARTSRSLSP